MRIFTAVALVVAVAAFAIAAIAIRSANEANQSAERASLLVEQANVRVATAHAQVERLEQRAKTVDALCWAARHADLPSRSSREYATNVGIAIIDGIVGACNYANLPDRRPEGS